MDPIIGRGKKRREAGVVPVGNKDSDGKARPSVWGPRQVGTVPQTQDPKYTQAYSQHDLSERREEQRNVAAVNPMHRGDVQRQPQAPQKSFNPQQQTFIDKSYGRAPKFLLKLSRLTTLLAVLYAWVLSYNQIIRNILPDQVYFDLTNTTFWKLFWQYCTRGYLTNSTFLEYTVAPVAGAVVSSLIVLILAYKFLLPLLNLISKPFVWLAGKLINLPNLFFKIKSWRSKVNTPRRASTGFGNNEHEPEQAFIEGPTNSFREAAIIRREEQDKKKEEEDDGEGDDTLSGAGGSVPGGGQSPNAIAAAMSGKMGGGNSV